MKTPEPLDQADWQKFTQGVVPLSTSKEPVSTAIPLPMPRVRKGKKSLINVGAESLQSKDQTTAMYYDERLTEQFSLEMSEALSYRRNGVRLSQLRQLRRSVVQEEVDLHGCTRAQALVQIENFWQGIVMRGLICVKVIHGKGKHSEAQQAILKPFIRQWLQWQTTVQAYIDSEGGGAVIVLLK